MCFTVSCNYTGEKQLFLYSLMQVFMVCTFGKCGKKVNFGMWLCTIHKMVFIFGFNCIRKPVFTNKSVCMLLVLDCSSHCQIGFKSCCLRFDSEVALKRKKTVISLPRNTRIRSWTDTHLFYFHLLGCWKLFSRLSKCRFEVWGLWLRFDSVIFFWLWRQHEGVYSASRDGN